MMIMRGLWGVPWWGGMGFWGCIHLSAPLFFIVSFSFSSRFGSLFFIEHASSDVFQLLWFRILFSSTSIILHDKSPF